MTRGEFRADVLRRAAALQAAFESAPGWLVIATVGVVAWIAALLLVNSALAWVGFGLIVGALAVAY